MGSFDCGTFSAHYVGRDHGVVTTWFDRNGDPVRQQGHLSAVETDTNESSGASVVVRTRLNVHVDFVANLTSITGIRNLSNQPGRGVVIQSVGKLLVQDLAEGPIAVHGPADDIDLGGGFCEALLRLSSRPRGTAGSVRRMVAEPRRCTPRRRT